MGNVVESVEHGKEPAVHDPDAGSEVEHVQHHGTDSADDEESAGLLPPTSTETHQVPSTSEVIHELGEFRVIGTSDDVNGEVDDSLIMGNPIPDHNNEIDAGNNQTLDLDVLERFASHRGPENTEEAYSAATPEIEQISESVRRNHSGSLIDEVAERRSTSEDSKEEEKELNSGVVFDGSHDPANWRSSTASTMTDVSECYQTALEDSDKDDMSETYDNFCNDNDDDNEDFLATTLHASDIKAEFTNEDLDRGMRFTLAKTLSEETITTSADLEFNLPNTWDETAVQHNDEQAYQQTSVVQLQGVVADVVAADMRARNQSLKHDLDDLDQHDDLAQHDDLDQHDVLITQQADHEDDSQSHVSKFEGIEITSNCSELGNVSGNSEERNEDGQDEKILSEQRCVSLSGVCPKINERGAVELLTPCGEEMGVCREVYVTEDISACSDIAIELKSEPVSENMKNSSCLKIANGSSDDITKEVTHVSESDDDSNHDIILEQGIDVTSAVGDVNLPNVEVRDCDVVEDNIGSGKSGNSEAHYSDRWLNQELLDDDDGLCISDQLSGLAIHGVDVVDYATHDATRDATHDATRDATHDATRDATRDATHDATRDATHDASRDASRDATHHDGVSLIECSEDSLPRAAKFSDEADILYQESRHFVETEPVVELSVDEHMEQDEGLVEEDASYDDGGGDSTAVLMWRILATMQGEGTSQEQDSEATRGESPDPGPETELDSNAVSCVESVSTTFGSDSPEFRDPDDRLESETSSFVTTENQSWNREEDDEEGEEEQEEEPDPDYSLSSDDEDIKPEVSEFYSVELSTEMESSKLMEEAASILPMPPSPPADYMNSPLSTNAGENGFFKALVEPTFIESLCDRQGLELTRGVDSSEDVDITLECLQAKMMTETNVVVVDDEDDGDRIGKFQRRTSVRPSKRSRSGNWPRRSTSSTSSAFPEVLEEEAGAVAEDSSAGPESVFDNVQTPQSAAKPNPWSHFRPILEDVDSRDPTHTPARDLTAQSDGPLLLKARNERRNATVVHKPEAFTNDTEWIPYSLVLRKDSTGFGIVLSRNDSPVTIMAANENGVAARNGIKVGDRINKVNGTLVSKNNHSQISEMIRTSGDRVRLELLRNSSESSAVPMTPVLHETVTPKLSKSTASLPSRGITELHPMRHLRDSTRSLFTTSSESPFSDPNLLKHKPAFLAIFLRYLFDEDKPYPMLFNMLSDYYQNCAKESISSTRRWAYEIYSTFLAENAPLKLDVDVRRVAPIHRVMKELAKAKDSELRSIFHQIRRTIKKDIIHQLNNFNERKCWPNSSEYQLLKMNQDRAVEFQMIDDALWKNFEHCISQDHDDTKRAIAYSLATFFQQVGFSGTRNSNLLDSCPTFLSNDKKSLKNKMKKHFADKGHQLSPRQFTVVTHCHACQKAVWGLGHQAYECSNCEMNFHRHCVGKITDTCAGNKSKDSSKRSVRDIIPGRKHLTIPGREESHRNFSFPSMFDQDAPKGNQPGEQPEGQVMRLSAPEVIYQGQGHSPRSLNASDDSDLEVSSELPELTDFISKEDLRQMKDKERKRQQIINELFHTERLHIRMLKVMNKVFLRPMLDDPAIDREFIQLLFPNLQELIQLHDDLNKDFLAKRKQKKVVYNIGQHLISKFSGSHGEIFKVACARFCADQSFALETLKARQKKEPKFYAFLQEAAMNPLCKRLELKDFLPGQMHRLTKYPLLIESLRKCTLPSSEELGHLSEALRLTKGVLEHVNQEAKAVQNRRHIKDMQQRLDQRAADSSVHPMLRAYRNFDLTKHTLVYDGEVTWRPFHVRSRPIEVHLVLFEDILVVLQKQDDRLLLRCPSTTVEDFKFQYCPIMKLNMLMVKDVATDRRAFFVLDSAVKSPQVYQLLARSREEKNKWCNYIQETVKRFIIRHPNQTDSAAASLVASALKSKSPIPHIAKLGSSPGLMPHDTVDHCEDERTREPISDMSSVRNDERNEQFTDDSAVDAIAVDDIAVDDVAVDDSHGDDVEAKETKLDHLKALTQQICRLMREKYEIETGTRVISNEFGDDDFQKDSIEIIDELVSQVTLLKELINDQQLLPLDTPDETFGTHKGTISLPAGKVVDHSAIIQRLMDQLTGRVVMNDEKMEKLEQEFQSVLKDMEKDVTFSSIHPNERLSNEQASSDITEESRSSSTQSQIFGESTGEESNSCDRSDRSENFDSDLTI